MAEADIFADLECPLHDEPLFFVERPDGRKDLPEIERQATFIAYMRKACPHMTVAAIPNAAKRGFKAQRIARKEGLLKGTFDTIVTWDVNHAREEHPATVAFLEWKGFDASGRAGKLSQAQINFGNKLHRQGHNVACFFSARTAVEWLRSLGAPVRGRIA